MQRRAKYSFIIPFFNGDEYIEHCLRSIFMHSDETCNVIIVNNSNKPTNIHEIARNFENVITIDAGAQIGFARASNLGAKIAIEHGAEYIICLNQDTVVRQDIVSELISPLTRSQNLVITAPILYTHNFEQVETFFIRWYLTQCPDLFYDALKGKIKNEYEVDYISGACFAMSCSFIKKYGFFDPIYFMYAEDEDLCRRVRYLGFNIVIIPTVKIAHFHSHVNCDAAEADVIRKWHRYSMAIYRLKNVKKPFHEVAASLMHDYLLDYISLAIKLRFIRLARNISSDIKLLISLPRILKSRKADSNVLKRIERSL